jgi:hypothetical protein
MSNVTDLNEFRRKKEEAEEAAMADDLYRLLSDIMIDDEPLIIEMIDSDGNRTLINLDDVLGLSDSNP